METSFVLIANIILHYEQNRTDIPKRQTLGGAIREIPLQEMGTTYNPTTPFRPGAEV
ncbi:hypothetical protein [Vreelandella neptunia]|uniref:hypothetical protein n=1 Tax=Vreelandella neptunia TaxID=115551 RepID=UPI00315AD097